MRVVRLLFFVALIVAGAYVVWDNNRDPAESAAPAPGASVTPSTLPPPDLPTSGTVATTFRKSLALLPVLAEDRRPYTRSLFGRGWADLDKDCRDTRAEVLARDSLVAIEKGCRVLRGKWLSYYDNKTWTKSFQVQIDHLVPLAEAWDSGAFAWDASTRIAYANDVGDARTLVPTTTALNYVKLADDPQWYIPKVNACRYIASWISVKLRWSMTVDKRELDAITKVAKSCPDGKITVKRPKLGLLP